MNDHFREEVRAFYEGKRQAIFAYALAVAHERGAAEDAVQHAFEGVLALGRMPEALEPYVYRSIRNAALDARRAKRRDETWDEAACVQPAPEITLRFEINELLNRLSADERETIVLKVFGSLTIREIAEMRGEALGTVASWYRRGIEKMRSFMKEEYA